MKVVELKKILETLSPDAEVIISTDAEGNRFSRLANAEACWTERKPDAVYDTEIVMDDELNEGDDLLRAIVLWPV
jgi:hypothetical protein